MTDGSNTEALLSQTIERLLEIERDKEALAEERKVAMKEAKDAGFDTKIIAKVVARMKRDRAEVEEEDQLIATYERSVL